MVTKFWFRSRNPNWPILSADTVADTKTTFQRENLVTDSMRFFFITKGSLKPNLLLNIKDFNSFLKICPILIFQKISPKEVEKHGKIQQKFKKK